MRSPSPTSAAAEQLLQTSETSIVTAIRRRHGPRTSIIVTTLFSILYFLSLSLSLFTSKLDIVLPSYIKSASKSVHRLYGTAEAHSYLEYLEDLAHPTVYFSQYIMSRAASDIGDVSGVLGGGRPQPLSPPTSVYASPSPPQSSLGPLDLIKKHDVVRGFSEFHIRRDATYIAPPSMDIKDIYNKFDEPILQPDWNLEDIILRCFRACPLHQNDVKIGYVVLTEKEYYHLYDSDEIKLTNVDMSTSRCIMGTPTSTSTSTYTNRLQTRSTSRLHHVCWLDPTTRSTSVGRRSTSGRTSTSLPSLSRWMILERGTSYVHIVETAVNIKSLNSISRPRHLHCMCKVLDISLW